MADVFKPTYKKPIPKGEKIQREKVDGQWKQYVKLKDGRGREIHGYLTKDGAHYLQPLEKWAGYYKDYFGKRHKISLCKDKSGAQSALNQLDDVIDNLRAGRSVPRLKELPPIIHKAVKDALESSGQITKTQMLSRKPISEHLKNYLTYLERKGSTPKHMTAVKRYVEVISSTCGFSTLAEIEVTPVEDFINVKKAEGASARTRNVYADRFRYFVAWAKKRHIIEVNPFEGWERLNEKANRVREARPLDQEEISRLLDAAGQRPLANRLKRGCKIKQGTCDELVRQGEKHRLIYALMLFTGLRMNEVRQLVWNDVDIDGDKPFLKVRASISKTPETVNLPLHTWLVAQLREWRKQNPGIGKSRPIVKVPSDSSLLNNLNRDLEFAGIPKTDESGKVVHLHAQRHTFITMLAHMGVQPHVAQKLARHSKAQMTMDIYTHVYRGEGREAVESLPMPIANACLKEATGTDGGSVAADSSQNPHVRTHVQNPGFSRVSLYPTDSKSQNTPKGSTSPTGSTKSLDGVTLGHEEHFLTTPDSPISDGAKTCGKNSARCQAGRAV